MTSPSEPAGTRRAPRPHRSESPGRSRRTLRAVGAVTGLVTVMGGVATWAEASAPEPVQALESLQLTLGSDGTVTKVDRTDIVRTGAGEFEREEGDLSPADAEKLPVIVSTSWVHDGKTGTDFADLKGDSGRIELGITLTNTTTRVEPFTIDVGDQHTQTYGLVSTPMTVVGAVELPEDSATKIIRSTSGRDEAGTTNGVVATGDDTGVQWAAVLAPPRLAASTTFRLVLDADDFEVPDFRISAQAGLVSDPSVETLFSQAFGKNSPIAQIQNSTAGLTDRLGAQLVATSSLLSGIRSTLDVNATEAGPAAIDSLSQSSQRSLAVLDGIISDIDGISQSAKQQIENARDQGLGAMDGALNAIVDYVGMPRDWKPADETVPFDADLTSSGCATAAPVDTKATLYEQLTAIRAAIHTANAASAACVDVAAANLALTIGTGEDCAAAGATSLACQFTVAATDLKDVKDDLVDAAGAAADVFSTKSGVVSTKLASLKAAVLGLQEDAAGISGSGSESESVKTELEELKETVADLADQNESLSDAVGDLSALIPDAETLAETTIPGKLASLESLICAEPDLDSLALADDVLTSLSGPLDVYREQLRSTVNTEACDSLGVSTEDAASDLRSLVAQDAANWTAARTAVDAADTGSEGLDDQLDAIAGTIGDLLDSFEDLGGNPGKGGVAKDLRKLLLKSCELLTVDDSLGCPVTGTPAPGPVDELSAAYGEFGTAVNEAKGDWERRINQAYEPIDGIAEKAKTDAVKANTAAQTAFADLLVKIEDSLVPNADRIKGDAAAALDSQVDTVTSKVTGAKSTLTTELGRAIAQLQTTLGGSIADLRGVRAMLNTQIADSIGDLRGVLGLFGAQSNQVASGESQLGTVQTEANGFGSVRRSDALDQLLASLQLDRGLALVAELPYFGDKLPDGSSHASIYSFVLKGDN